jgi:hypothetical protein
MTRGKTIQIYLPDGNPKGIKKCQIRESICRAILIPRYELIKLKFLTELDETGVYFLITKIEETDDIKIYIGEAEKLNTRLKQHDTNKEEWNYAICFYSATKNLNKAHIKFLESHCYKRLKELNRLDLINGNCPTQSKIEEEDENLILSFFDDLRILLSTLGYPVFEEIKKTNNENEIFFCKEKEAFAKGNLTEEGFVVYAGSLAKLNESASAGSWVVNLRNRLKENKILIESKGTLKFQKDFIFGSPSAAAVAVLARRSNGWIEWKNKENKTLDEINRRGKK